MKTSKTLPALVMAFSLAALTGCSGKGTHNCTGANQENVDITWEKYSASAVVTNTTGNSYELTSWNKKMLASQHVRGLGGTCAQWYP